MVAGVERNLESLNDKDLAEEIRALKTGARVEYDDIKEQLKKIEVRKSMGVICGCRRRLRDWKRSRTDRNRG